MIPTTLPGLLSDRQIRELCTPPKFMVTEYFEQPQDPMHDAYFLPQPKTYGSYATAEMLDKQIQQRKSRQGGFGGDGYNAVGVSSYRPLTPEEIAAFKPMISPFEPKQVRTRPMSFEEQRTSSAEERILFQRDGGMVMEKKVISYGLSSYGYDVRCADDFKIFTNVHSAQVDPKHFDEQSFVDMKPGKHGYVVIPPNSFALARTLEYMRIPRDVLVVCLGKSTYARTGIVVNVTPLEPGWEGHVTLEFSNTTPLPARIYANEGCAQFLFFRGSEPCEVSYADRGGKYQGQTGVTLPKA